MASSRSLLRAACGSLALAAALPAPPAAAAPPSAPSPPPAPALGPERQRMSVLMKEYFEGERAQAHLFLGSGLAAFGAGAFLLTRGDLAAEGAAYPVLAIGILQVAVGAGLLVRTDAQIAEHDARIAADPAGFKHAERARLDGVLRRFKVAEYIEAGAAAAGLGLVAYGEAARQPLATGIGAGLAAQSALMLGLDYLADRRAQRYAAALSGFNPCISREGFALSYGATF